MGSSHHKKRYSSTTSLYSTSSSRAPHRLRERSKLSFLFVIFFFGLFSLIIVMESLMTEGGGGGNRSLIFKGEEGVGDSDSSSSFTDGDNQEYSSWDISYEEVKPLKKKQKVPSIIQQKAQNLNSTFTNNYSDWQKVVGTKERFYVYSAYHNTAFRHIRIIGATRTKSVQKVGCRFYDNETRVYTTVNATIRTIRENWNLKFSACFVICLIPPNKPPPLYVSIMPTTSSSSSTPASNLLKVQYPSTQRRTQTLVDFSVCVKPIHFAYDQILPFLEWVEFHRLMGIRRFTFYNHTIGQGVTCLMREYLKDVDIQVLPWSLPFVSQKEIRTEGLFSALNDCVYRHRGSSKYLVIVDLDEMIVPKKAMNYSSLIDKLDTLSNRKKIGAYSFQNGFFYLQWPDDQSVFKIEGNDLAERVSRKLLSLRKTRRRSRLHPHKQRSKYICDPEKVVEAGNHFIWEMATGYYTLSVPPHLGTLHHYRVCEFGGDQCVKSPFVVDKSSHNFGQELAIRVAEKLLEFGEKCHLDINHVIDSQQTMHGETPIPTVKTGNNNNKHTR